MKTKQSVEKDLKVLEKKHTVAIQQYYHNYNTNKKMNNKQK